MLPIGRQGGQRAGDDTPCTAAIAARTQTAGPPAHAHHRRQGDQRKWQTSDLSVFRNAVSRLDSGVRWPWVHSRDVSRSTGDEVHASIRAAASVSFIRQAHSTHAGRRLLIPVSSLFAPGRSAPLVLELFASPTCSSAVVHRTCSSRKRISPKRPNPVKPAAHARSSRPATCPSTTPGSCVRSPRPPSSDRSSALLKAS